MKNKNLLARILIGFAGGLVICLAVGTMISLAKGQPLLSGMNPPELTALMGSEITATVFSFFICGLLGAVLSAASLIYEDESRPLMVNTLIHLAVTFISVLLSGLILKWFTLNVGQLLGFALSFLILYFVIWVILYLNIRNQIRKMNEKIQAK